jgi:hypothetical protein
MTSKASSVWGQSNSSPNEARARTCACALIPCPSPHTTTRRSCSAGAASARVPERLNRHHGAPVTHRTTVPSASTRYGPVPVASLTGTLSVTSGRRSTACSDVTPETRTPCAATMLIGASMSRNHRTKDAHGPLPDEVPVQAPRWHVTHSRPVLCSRCSPCRPGTSHGRAYRRSFFAIMTSDVAQPVACTATECCERAGG